MGAPAVSQGDHARTANHLPAHGAFAGHGRAHRRIGRKAPHVIVDQVDRHKTKGNQFEVHVVLHVPGRGEVVATRRSHEDPYLAVNEAFETVTRELEKEIEMLRGEVKRHTDERGDNALP